MSRTRTITEMLLIFLTFFLPGYLVQGLGGGTATATDLLMLQSLLTGLPQILLIAYIMGINGPFNAPAWGCVRPVARDAAWLALIVPACFAIIAPFAFLATLLPPAWTAAFTAGIRWNLPSPFLLPLGLLFCLTAGYREELFYRSYLLGRLEGLGASMPLAVGGSTLLFCLGHLYEGPLGVLVAAGIGLLLSLVYVKRRNLHLIAVAHGLYNFIVLGLSLFGGGSLP